MNDFLTRNFVALNCETYRRKNQRNAESNGYQTNPFGQTQTVRSTEVLGSLMQASEKNIETL